ncbi:MAG: hypothetical protein IPM40_15715 [Gammaproteobacteria bacterium]|nr:hypothetical protein [Gammaproteobacteria bacterium]
MSTTRRKRQRVATLPALTPEQRASRRRLREALRWQRHAINACRRGSLMPPRFEGITRELLDTAVAEVRERDALGLSRPRSFTFRASPSRFATRAGSASS